MVNGSGILVVMAWLRLRAVAGSLALAMGAGCASNDSSGGAGGTGPSELSPVDGGDSGGADSAGAGGNATGGVGAAGGSGGIAGSGGGGAGGDSTCDAMDGDGFFPDCTACGSNCDSIDTGAGTRSACGCETAGCPCGLTCGCYSLGPSINVCDLCIL